MGCSWAIAVALWWLLCAGVARVGLVGTLTREGYVRGKVPHLRWSQAPPRPWRRPGSADYIIYIILYNYILYIFNYIIYIIIYYIFVKYVQTLTLPTLDSQALRNEHSLWWNPAGMLPGNWPLHPPFPVRCEGYMQVRLRRDSCSDTLRWAERSLCDLVLASSDISDISEAFIGV